MASASNNHQQIVLAPSDNNNSKRHLVDPKGWSLETAQDAVCALVQEPLQQNLVLQLQREAPRLRKEAQRLLWDHQVSEWEYYQTCLVVMLTNWEPSFLQEVLVPCIRDVCSSDGPQHALLQQVFGIHQSLLGEGSDDEVCRNVLNISRRLQFMVLPRRPLKRRRRNQHSSSSSEWKVPFVYIMTHVLCHSNEKKRIEWNQLAKDVASVLNKSFTDLLPADLQAGLALYALGVFSASKDEVTVSHFGNKKVALEGLTPHGLVDLLLEPNVLYLLQSVARVPRYNWAAKCAQIIVRYSYTCRDETLHGQNCVCARKLLAVGGTAMAHLDSLDTASKSAASVATTAQHKRITPSESSDMRSEVLSPAFPLLMEIELDLCVDRRMQAIGIAELVESCSLLSDQDRTKAWLLVLDYLRHESLIFLDGNMSRTVTYQQKRSLLINIVTTMGNLGRQAMLDYYQRLVKEVESCTEATPEEIVYITTAAQQTVLRLCIAKYETERGIGYFRETFPSASLWTGDVQRWGIRFLSNPPKVPASMSVDGFADLTDLMKRIAPQETAEEEEKPAASLEAAVEEVPLEAVAETENMKVENEIVILDDSDDEEVVMGTPSEDDSEVQETRSETDHDSLVGAARSDDETAEPEHVTALFDSDEEPHTQLLETVHEEAESSEEVFDSDETEEEEEESVEVVHDESDQMEVVGHTEEEETWNEDEKGYEPDTAYGYTEEEVSEAVHTEEEEEEEEDGHGSETKELVLGARYRAQHPTARVPYSENDMDEADERTASEVEVHDEESAMGEHSDRASALLALAQASDQRLAADSTPPKSTGSASHLSPSSPPVDQHVTKEITQPVVNKVPDEDVEYAGQDHSSSAPASATDQNISDHAEEDEQEEQGSRESPSLPVVNKVPIEEQHVGYGDNTTAATAPSDVGRYLSEFTEETSWKEPTAEMPQVETRREEEVIVEQYPEEDWNKSATTSSLSRASILVHGGDSPKETIDTETSVASDEGIEAEMVKDNKAQQEVDAGQKEEQGEAASGQAPPSVLVQTAGEPDQREEMHKMADGANLTDDTHLQERQDVEAGAKEEQGEAASGQAPPGVLVHTEGEPDQRGEMHEMADEAQVTDETHLQEQQDIVAGEKEEQGESASGQAPPGVLVHTEGEPDQREEMHEMADEAQVADETHLQEQQDIDAGEKDEESHDETGVASTTKLDAADSLQDEDQRMESDEDKNRSIPEETNAGDYKAAPASEQDLIDRTSKDVAIESTDKVVVENELEQLGSPTLPSGEHEMEDSGQVEATLHTEVTNVVEKAKVDLSASTEPTIQAPALDENKVESKHDFSTDDRSVEKMEECSTPDTGLAKSTGKHVGPENEAESDGEPGKVAQELQGIDTASEDDDEKSDAESIPPATSTPSHEVSTQSVTSVRHSGRKLTPRKDNDFVYEKNGGLRNEMQEDAEERSQESGPEQEASDAEQAHSPTKKPASPSSVSHDGELHRQRAEEISHQDRVMDSPAIHTRSHDRTMDSPAMHTRSHDRESEMQEHVVERSEESGQEQEASEEEQAHSPTKGPATPSSISHGGQSYRERAEEIAQHGHVMDSPAMHTRSHDRTMGSPAMHTRSHDRESRDAVVEAEEEVPDSPSSIPVGQSIVVGAESPAVSSIVSSMDSSVVSRRRTRTAGKRKDETQLSAVDEAESDTTVTRAGAAKKSTKAASTPVSSVRRSSRRKAPKVKESPKTEKKHSAAGKSRKRRQSRTTDSEDNIAEVDVGEGEESTHSLRRSRRRHAAPAADADTVDAGNQRKKPLTHRSGRSTTKRKRRTADSDDDNLQSEEEKENPKRKSNRGRSGGAASVRRNTEEQSKTSSSTNNARKRQRASASLDDVAETDSDSEEKQKTVSIRKSNRGRKSKAATAAEDESSTKSPPKKSKGRQAAAKSDGDEVSSKRGRTTRSKAKKPSASPVSTRAATRRTRTTKTAEDSSVSTRVSTRRSTRISARSKK